MSQTKFWLFFYHGVFYKIYIFARLDLDAAFMLSVTINILIASYHQLVTDLLLTSVSVLHLIISIGSSLHILVPANPSTTMSNAGWWPTIYMAMQFKSAHKEIINKLQHGWHFEKTLPCAVFSLHICRNELFFMYNLLTNLSSFLPLLKTSKGFNSMQHYNVN